jgi:hypothetical protein
MGVVDEAVEDGVGIGWVADDLVPFILIPAVGAE